MGSGLDPQHLCVPEGCPVKVESREFLVQGYVVSQVFSDTGLEARI